MQGLWPAYSAVYPHETATDLKKLVQELEPGHEKGPVGRFIASAKALDQALFDWRRVHLGVARNYLADLDGSGGTPGFAYLKAHYSNRIFSQEPPNQHEKSLTPSGSLGAVKPIFGIAN
ncbi:MAG TPA: hypothetical protein VK188_18010 [Holophaga sp.]|nr:hypothetical protein [Holophaga sp.]